MLLEIQETSLKEEPMRDLTRLWYIGLHLRKSDGRTERRKKSVRTTFIQILALTDDEAEEDCEWEEE